MIKLKKLIFIAFITCLYSQSVENLELSLNSINIISDDNWYCFSEKNIKYVAPRAGEKSAVKNGYNFKDLLLPEPLLWVGVNGSSIYALAVPKRAVRIGPTGIQTDAVIQNIWCSDGGNRWTIVGALEGMLSHSISMVPLGQGRFFLVSSLGFFRSGESAAPCCVAFFDKNSNEIKLESLIELDFEGPPLRIPIGARAPAVGTQMWEKYKKYRLFMTMQTDLSFPLRQVNDRFVIWSNHFGYFWIFDNNGKLVKRVKLFSELSDDLIANRWDYERAVICVQPLLSNSLIVESRSRDAVLKARKAYPLIFTDNLKTKLNNRFSMEDFPEINWWELDVSSGDFSVRSSPPGAPNNLLDSGTEELCQFIVMPDGRVKFPGFSPRSRN